MQINYTALNYQQERIQGTIEASSERQALQLLSKQGLVPIALIENQAIKRPVSRRFGWHKQKPVSPKALLVAFEQLLVMLKSGLSLHRATLSLGRSLGHDGIATQFNGIAQQLGRGDSFSIALSESELKLPAYLLQLVKAGELSGKLIEALEDGLAQFRYEQRVNSEVRNAMIYPLILIFAGIIAVGIIFTAVVPKFTNLLNKVEDLPTISVWVLSVGRFASEQAVWLGIGIISFVVLIYIGLKYLHLGKHLLNSLSRLPGLKVFFLESELGRWSYLVGTLLSNRVSVLEAIQLANEGVRISWMQARLFQVSRSVKEGGGIAESLKNIHLFPPVGLDLMIVGEQSSKLADMLQSVSIMFADSSKQKIERFLQLLEPVAILFLGLVIGVIMAGIILAITSMNDAFV